MTLNLSFIFSSIDHRVAKLNCFLLPNIPTSLPAYSFHLACNNWNTIYFKAFRKSNKVSSKKIIFKNFFRAKTYAAGDHTLALISLSLRAIYHICFFLLLQAAGILTVCLLVSGSCDSIFLETGSEKNMVSTASSFFDCPLRET